MFDYFNSNERDSQSVFKSKRDKLLKKPCEFLTKYNITPNNVTIFSIFLFFIACYFVKDYPIFGGLLGFIYCLLDGLDGPLARYQNRQSEAGSLIDIFADHVGIIVLPVLSVYYFETNFVFAYIFGLFYTIAIFLATILNTIKIKIQMLIRIKYVYYFLFLVTAYTNKDYLYFIYYIFGLYYLLYSLYLYYKLVKHYY